MADEQHYTEEGTGPVNASLPNAVEEARKRHHLASADPEPERDGTLTGPAHEEKYGLDRASESAELWRGAGVHPTENRALKPGEDGYEGPELETTSAAKPPANTDAPRAGDSK